MPDETEGGKPQSTGSERKDGRQNAVIHEGAEPDPLSDGKHADERTQVVEPDSSPSPRAEKD
jgi:hypothetical protein